MTFSKANGLSINDKWVNEIPKDVIESFKGSDPPIFFIGSGFGKEAVPSLKTGGELARELRDELGLNSNNEDSLSELLQYLMNNQAGSKRAVTEWLKKNLGHGDSKPGGAHRLLLELPSQMFLTTNYDSLIGDASIQMGYTLKVIDNPSSFDSNLNDIKSKNRNGVLARLHGAFEDQDNIVATTNDYIARYSNGNNGWQSLLEEIFRTRQVIFIGYSLKDFTTWTSFVSVITKWKNTVYPHVMVSPVRSEHISRFWSNYKIRYIPLKASQFLIAIHDQLGNLENNEQIAISAVAACLGKTYDDAKREVETQKERLLLKSPTMTAIKMLMDGCDEN